MSPVPSPGPGTQLVFNKCCFVWANLPVTNTDLCRTRAGAGGGLPRVLAVCLAAQETWGTSARTQSPARCSSRLGLNLTFLKRRVF